MKTKQELIEEWESAIEDAEFYGKGKEDRLIGYMRDFVDDLNQLDEPELPVIPKFVADWYENYRDNLENQLQGITYNLDRYGRMSEVSDLDKWINEMESPLQTLASLKFGYEVEKDQKYILSINITDKDSNTNYETFLNKRGIFHSMENDSFNNEEFNWSEEEIKGLENGEILFEHFVEKVEELE